MPLRMFNPKLAAVLGAGVALTLVGGLFYIGYFSDHHEPDCQVFPVQMVLSPSGAYKAEQEQEACASTDQLRTTVTISQAGGNSVPAEPTPTVFVAVSGKALGAMAAGQRSVALRLRWDGDGELVITHPPGLLPNLPPGTRGRIKVRYEAAGAAAQ